MEATYFVHKNGNAKTKGVPISAMLQCRTPLNNNEKFYLYECLNGGGFFLRGMDEFMDRFIAVSNKKKQTEWTHKDKGGRYHMCGIFMYVGSPMENQDMDGAMMKAYFMEHNKDGGLFCSAAQFAREFEPRYVVKWYDTPENIQAIKHEDIRKPINMNVKFDTPDAPKFKATQAQVSAQVGAAIERARKRGGFAAPLPQWADSPKAIIKSDEGFITVYKDGPFHVALVSRDWCKDVRVRGDNLTEVMQAAQALLWSKP